MTFLLLTLALSAPADKPKPVAMVLAVSGDVRLTHGTDAPQPPTRMALLFDKDRLATPAVGGCRVVFLSDGHTEDVKPGRVVALSRAGGEPAEAIVRGTHALPESSIRGLRTLAESGRAGVEIARWPADGPPAFTPIHTATIRTDRPVFSWPAAEKAEGYILGVAKGKTAATATVLWTAECKENTLAYPAGQAALSAGETYFWTVAARGPKPRKPMTATFRVAGADEARGLQEVAALAASKDPADRLLAAAAYEGAKAYAEALGLYGTLAKAFPEERGVLLALAENLNRAGQLDEAYVVLQKVIAMETKK